MSSHPTVQTLALLSAKRTEFNLNAAETNISEIYTELYEEEQKLKEDTQKLHELRESTVLTAAELEENAKLNQEEYEKMKNMVEDFLKLNFRDLNIDTEIDDLMDTLIDDTLRNQLSPTTQLSLIQQMIHTLDSLKSDIAQHTDPVVIKAMKLKPLVKSKENIDSLKLRMNSSRYYMINF